MSTLPALIKPHGVALLLGWRRLLFTLCASVVLGLILLPGWDSGWFALMLRTGTLGLAAMLAFGIFEQWPARLPAWLARWVLQVVGVAVSIPLVTWLIYLYSTMPGAPPFWEDKDRLEGFVSLSVLGLLVAPWIALGALVRQKDALARHQALVFDLERSELERQALDARLRLLQAQVTPHFLFNTLANVQVLVDEGSPQASMVLRNLVAYLRAAVPRLDAPATTLADELELAQAYLELMHIRIPDRLQFGLHVDEAARSLRCPPLTLLTLVENAVRHGIDPSEDGGRIDVHVERRGDRCVVRVIDTGVGLRANRKGLGTGIATLRERMAMAFGGDATLNIAARLPRGVVAEAIFPAQEAGHA